MDPELKLELLELAKKNIELGVEAIELVTSEDGERGKFYGSNSAEYMRDALKAPKGLEGYIDDLKKEIEVAEEQLLEWTEIVLEDGYEALEVGESIRLDDHIYLHDEWGSIKDVFKDKADLFRGYVYTGRKFYIARATEKSKKIPKVPAGFRALRPGEKIRWSDKVYTTKGDFALFSEMNADTKAYVGTPYSQDNFLMVIRSLQLNPNQDRPEPLQNFRELAEKEPIAGNDMVRINKVWMLADSAPVVSKHGNLIGVLYNSKTLPLITRRKADQIKVDASV